MLMKLAVISFLLTYYFGYISPSDYFFYSILCETLCSVVGFPGTRNTEFTKVHRAHKVGLVANLHICSSYFSSFWVSSLMSTFSME